MISKKIEEQRHELSWCSERIKEAEEILANYNKPMDMDSVVDDLDYVNNTIYKILDALESIQKESIERTKGRIYHITPIDSCGESPEQNDVWDRSLGFASIVNEAKQDFRNLPECFKVDENGVFEVNDTVRNEFLKPKFEKLKELINDLSYEDLLDGKIADIIWCLDCNDCYVCNDYGWTKTIQRWLEETPNGKYVIRATYEYYPFER